MRHNNNRQNNYNNQKTLNNQTKTNSLITSTKQQVWTNHFEIQANLKIKVYQVTLKVTPTLPKDKIHLKGQLIKIANVELKKLLGDHFYITGDQIYTMKPLTSDSQLVASLSQYQMTVCKTTEEFTVDEIFSNSKKYPEINRFLNVVLKNFLESTGLIQYGKHSSYFNPKQPPILIEGTNLLILKGYKMNIDKHMDDKLRLNIDTCFRISSSISIFDEFEEYVYQEKRDKDAAKARFTSENIIGRSFSILNDFNKMIKIHGVDPTKTLKSSSPVEGYLTFKDYFEDKF